MIKNRRWSRSESFWYIHKFGSQIEKSFRGRDNLNRSLVFNKKISSFNKLKIHLHFSYVELFLRIWYMRAGKVAIWKVSFHILYKAKNWTRDRPWQKETIYCYGLWFREQRDVYLFIYDNHKIRKIVDLSRCSLNIFNFRLEKN